MDIEVNYLAVLLAGLSTMVVGSIWYTPKVFGNTWAKLAHVNLNKKLSTTDMVYLYGGALLASLVTATVLAHVSFMTHKFMGNEFLLDTLTTAFWLWLGFTALRVFTHDSFEGRRKKLTLLTFGNEFVTVMVMALIIGSMGF